jgi:predicted acylesterase/phospholipase RssA
LRPRLIAGVSAGAATACLLFANNSKTALTYYREHLSGPRKNFYLSGLFTKRRSVFPHHAIYRQALRELLGGEHFLLLQRNAPEIRVQYSRLPRHLGPRLSVVLGITLYNIEKYGKHPLHPTWGRRLGFTPEVAKINQCKDEEDLASLLIASSCTPPFTPLEFREGRPTLDGGMVDNVPVDAVESGATTLVLVTRRYPDRTDSFTHQGRLYVQPSRKVPISSWDYTRPEAMVATYDLGRRDGERFVAHWERHRSWLADAIAAPSGGKSRDLGA